MPNPTLRLFSLIACIVAALALTSREGAADTLSSFLPDLSPDQLFDGAEAFGPVRQDIPVAPILMLVSVASVRWCPVWQQPATPVCATEITCLPSP